MTVKYKKRKINEEISLIEFNIEGGVITPQEIPEALEGLKKILSPSSSGDKIIILSGRGPIWLYGSLLHELHPFRGVALFDPRLQVGKVIKFNYPQ